MTKNKTETKEQMIEDILKYASFSHLRKDLEKMEFHALKAIHNSCMVPLMKGTKIMKAILFIAFLNFTFWGVASNGEGKKNTSQVNETDQKGRKQGKWIFYGKDNPKKGYPEEGKIAEGIFKDDRKNGLWTNYYKDGFTPRLVGDYKNNRPFGTYQKFYRNGELMEEGTFKGRRYVDTLKRFSKNGTLTYQANYNESGQESGEVKYFYDNGTPEFIYLANNGTPTGKAIRYWSNGEVKEEIEFNQNGKIENTTGTIEPEKVVVEVDKSNLKTAPKVEEKITSYEVNGYNTIYNQNNELWMVGDFKNKRLWDGKLYVYDEDGLLQKVEVYKEGVFHSNGQL